MEKFLNFYEKFLHVFAEITVHTLEIIGISIIIFGSVKVLIQTARRHKNKEAEPQNVIIALGRSLALALEFKMGAEIVNTVIIRDRLQTYSFANFANRWRKTTIDNL